MKRHRFRASPLVSLCCTVLITLTLLSGCGTGRKEAAAYPAKPGTVTGETPLSDIYTVTETDGASIRQEAKDMRYTLSEGDVVLVIEEEKNDYRVLVPAGSLPYLRGKISKDAVSFGAELFQNANQAFLKNVPLYDAIEGSIVDESASPGAVQVLERENGWALIEAPGGEGRYWAEESALTYQFWPEITDIK